MVISRLILALLLCVSGMGKAAAETSEVRIAQQYGLTYLPFMVMEHNKLLEKHARAAGLGDIKVSWFKFSGGNVMNDALLSGNLDFANSGLPAFLTLWARTRDNLNVRAVGAYNSLPLVLNVRNPSVKSVRDFTDKDRIAVPAVKASMQAMLLQMEVEKIWGVGNHGKLDHLTISRGHPDAMAALLQPNSEITAHFAAPPYINHELKAPGVRSILTGEDALGGPMTVGIAYGSGKFRDANPKTYAAFFGALREAIDFLNQNKREAAEIYLKMSKEKGTAESILAQLNAPKMSFSIVPQSTVKFAQFMHRTGQIKALPARWQELFFPEAHSLPGS